MGEVAMTDYTLPGGSGFLRLPASRLGRASAWLFVGAIALLMVGPFIGSALGEFEIGQLNVGPLIGVLVLAAAAITGAISLIKDHERSWVVWLAVALPSLVIGAEIISLLIPGE